MSIINTKAGWVCQENYFVDGTGECGTRNNKVFSKTNDGAAICAKYVYNDTSNIILVSTVESYTAATYDGTTTNIVTISAVIDDVTWYGTYYSNGADNWITSYPTITGTAAISSATAEDVISKILITAQAKRDDSLPTGDIVKDLVTVDYVKSLLTNILTENNTRIFGQMSLMSLLQYIEQTLTAEQQAQARQNIGAAASEDIPTAEQQAAWTAKQNALTFDNTPTQGSTNPVTSDGIYTAIQNAGGGGGSTNAVLYTAQSLTSAQQTQARQNIGAGTSNFNGNYNSLTNVPPFAKSSGAYSVAGGQYSTASAQYGFAYGYQVVTTHNFEVAFGKHNSSSADTAFAFGNGTDSPADKRHNLMELKTDGTLLLNGNPVAVLSALTGYVATKTQVRLHGQMRHKKKGSYLIIKIK